MYTVDHIADQDLLTAEEEATVQEDIEVVDQTLIVLQCQAEGGM